MYNGCEMTDRRKTPLEIHVTESHQCSVEVRLDILGRVPFFAGLSHDRLEQINGLFLEFGYATDELIYLSGDPGERLFVVADGRVRLMRHSLSGKNVLLDLLRPGEFFGSLSTMGGDPYPDTAEAQTQTCVLSIRTDDFRRILQEHPPVALIVLDITGSRLRAAHERVRQLSALPVEGRIANLLLLLAGKFGERREVGLLIQVPLTRDDLAAMAGTTTETASRVMSQFQRDGLIKTGRQWAAILQPEALERIAGVEIP
jgi:CRP-like cAMP-binding protein